MAYSTFHKWRTALANRDAVIEPVAVTTADAMFIPIVAETAAVPSSPSVPLPIPSPKSASRDSVILTGGGVRIELNSVHADRIVRHLLARLGAAC